MERLIEEETSENEPPPEVDPSKTNGKPKEATPEEIRQLMSEYDKDGLKKLAVKAGVANSGSKATIAKRILER